MNDTAELAPGDAALGRAHRRHAATLNIWSSNFPRFNVNPNTGEPSVGIGAG
jgi:hypothetical protein